MATKSRSARWWKKIVNQYESRKGSITLTEFAAEQGINYQTFIKRLYRVRHDQLEEEQFSEDLGLVPVDVVNTHCPNDPVPEDSISLVSTPATWLEAETPSGLKVRFSDATNSGYVADLVRQMAGGA